MTDQEALAALRQRVQQLQQQLQTQQQVVHNQQQQLQELQQHIQNDSAQPRSGPASQKSVPTVAVNAGSAVADPDVCRIAVKLPPFWADSPEVWFAQVQAQFCLARITQDRTRYDYVVAHLDPGYATELRDILTRPPADDSYVHLKKELIRRLSPSEDQKVCQLLQHEELGDHKPSQFPRHMRALAGNTRIDDSLLRTIWLQRLPSHAQAILQVQPNLPLDQVPQIADRVIAIPLPSPQFTVQSVGAPQPTPELARRIEDMARQLNWFQRHLDEHPQSRHRNHSQSHDSAPTYRFLTITAAATAIVASVTGPGNVKHPIQPDVRENFTGSM